MTTIEVVYETISKAHGHDVAMAVFMALENYTPNDRDTWRYGTRACVTLEQLQTE